jgi:hypothetical protein
VRVIKHSSPERPQVSDRELYEKLLCASPPGSGHRAFMEERAELLLRGVGEGLNVTILQKKEMTARVPWPSLY